MPGQTQLKEKPVSAETMKAVRIHGYGGTDVLRYEDAPRPAPGAGEVLVKVHAAGVNPVDWKVREGYLARMRPYSFPLILGWDVSGVVESAGGARFKEGDAVYGLLDASRDGAYAEHVVAREADLALKPASLDHVQAAAVPLAALTAWQAIFDLGGLNLGQKILVHGGAGGVGGFAVQFSKWKGAWVGATASEAHLRYAWGLGADEVVDYKKVRFEEAVQDVDVVLDTVGGETQERSWKVLKKGGILVSTVQPPSPQEAAAHGARQAIVGVRPHGPTLEHIASLIDGGKVRVEVSRAILLSEAGRAQELSRSGHVQGKIVLKVA